MELDDILSEIGEGYIDLAEKEDCEESLLAMVGFTWDIIEPGTPLVYGWPLEAITAHLEATYYGHIKRLLITVPPGFMKSTAVNIAFPAWCWAKKPHLRFICTSYSEGLTHRDNQRCRRVIVSEKYQKYWGDKVKLVVPNTVEKFENTATGWKLATSVGGELLGQRANFLLIDDPNNPLIYSDPRRESTNQWFKNVVPTRLNSQEDDVIIVIQQRLHLEDCAGTALSLEHENYVHLNIPMEYEVRPYVNGYLPNSDQIQTFFDDEALAVPPDDVFWSDPRTHEGELAWRARFSESAVAKLKKTLGPTMASAQLQQRPVPRGGGIIKTEWWQTWREKTFPKFEFILGTLDTAYTEEKQNDPSGMTIWGLCRDSFQNPQVMLIYAWTDWIEFHDLVERVIIHCTKDERPNPKDFLRFPVDRLLIEGKASGLSVQQEIARLVGRSGKFGIEIHNPDQLGDKYSRLVGVQHVYSSGMVWAPDTDWATAVIDQNATFPFHPHDEYVDCGSMAMRWFRDCGFLPTKEEELEDKSAEEAYPQKMGALYPA